VSQLDFGGSVLATRNFVLIWFAVIVRRRDEISLITPPVVMNCFVSCALSSRTFSLSTIFRGRSARSGRRDIVRLGVCFYGESRRSRLLLLNLAASSGKERTAIALSWANALLAAPSRHIRFGRGYLLSYTTPPPTFSFGLTVAVAG